MVQWEAEASMVQRQSPHRVMSAHDTPPHQRPPILFGVQLARGKGRSSGLLAADALVGVVRRDFSELGNLMFNFRM